MKTKFQLLLAMLLFCVGLTAQQEHEPATDHDDQVITVIADDAPKVVEDIVLGLDAPAETAEPDPGLLASNYQVPDTGSGGEDEPFDWADWFFGFISGLIPESVMEWFGTILIVGEIVVRATPTQTDDKWFLWVKRIIDAILPSKKKGGGSFPRADNTPI